MKPVCMIVLYIYILKAPETGGFIAQTITLAQVTAHTLYSRRQEETVCFCKSTRYFTSMMKTHLMFNAIR